MCHIATTTLIRKSKYEWDSVDASELQVVVYGVGVRVARNDYRQAKPRTAIGIYSLKAAKDLDIVGRVDRRKIYARRLTFTVGDVAKRTPTRH